MGPRFKSGRRLRAKRGTPTGLEREGVGEREFPVKEGMGKPWVSQAFLSGRWRCHITTSKQLPMDAPLENRGFPKWVVALLHYRQSQKICKNPKSKKR